MTLFDNIKTFFKEKVRKHLTSRLALVVVTAACAVMLLIQYFGRPDALSPFTVLSAVVVPFQAGVNEIGTFLFENEQERRSLADARVYIDEIEKENDRLKLRNEELSQLINENAELRRLLEAKGRLGDYASVDAEIIGFDGTNLFERLIIDKGKDDGIAVNMNVVNGDGLIGIVTTVGPNYAIVETILEDGMNVSAMTRDTFENCIAAGAFKDRFINEMVLTNLLADTGIRADNLLVTSSISDRFLPNLRIGTVTEVTVEEGKLTASGRVKTAVDFSHLHHVLIITTLKEEIGND